MGQCKSSAKGRFIAIQPYLKKQEKSQINNLTLHLKHGEGNGTPLQCSCLENPMDRGSWWAAVHGVTRSRTRLSNFTLFFHFHSLEKEMATHSSVLAWRIPGTAGPGRLPSMGSHRVRHDWSDLAVAAAKGRFRAIQAYLKKQEKSQINNLTLHVKQLEKEKNEEPQG